MASVRFRRRGVRRSTGRANEGAGPAPPSGLYPFDERVEVLPLVPHTTGAVLDVGCGRGGFGRSLRTSGRVGTIWALEEDEAFGREAAHNYDELIVGSFPAALAGHSTRFDCIVFNDVLEHMADPWDALREARTHLEPGGTVVASIPNVRNVRTVFDLLVRGDWTYVDMGVLDRTHLRFFTKRTVHALFRDSGYEVEVLYGINPLGQSRFPLGRVMPLLFGELAYTGFAVRARATMNTNT